MLSALVLSAATLVGAGSVSDPIEPLDVSMVELFLSTEGAESSCGAYTAAEELALMAGTSEYVSMMQDMAESYLFVQFETIMSDNLGGTYRMSDDARDAFHAHLITC